MDLSTHSMVPLEFFGIALAFLIMTALSLWILIGAKGHWVFKMGFIAITLLFSIGMWNSFNDLLGWPTTEKVPDKFEILWVVVEEPNKRTNDDGAIYIWIKNLEPKDDSFSLSFNSKDVSKGSRLYKLPYNRAMHEQVPGILDKIKEKSSPSFKASISIDVWAEELSTLLAFSHSVLTQPAAQRLSNER